MKKRGIVCFVTGTLVLSMAAPAAAAVPQTGAANTDAAVISETGTSAVTAAAESGAEQTNENTESPAKLTQKITVRSTRIVRAYKSGSISLQAKNSAGRKMVFKSSNSKVVRVDSKGNIKAGNYGNAVIKITAAGSSTYKDAAPVYVSVSVVPKKVKWKSVRTQSGGYLQMRWKYDKTVTKYQVQISTSKKFPSDGEKTFTFNYKGVKRVKPKSYTNAARLKGLKRRHTYYVRMRAAKQVGTKNGKRIYNYGSWGTVVKVKGK